jgi:hypothetical protein
VRSIVVWGATALRRPPAAKGAGTVLADHGLPVGVSTFAVLCHIVGFWFLLYIWTKQVRCLHYCFVGISDWGTDTPRQVVASWGDNYGRKNVPSHWLNIEEEWKEEVDFYTSRQRRAHVFVPKNNYIKYIMEDLR